jgi:hypothetical protein
MHYRPTLQLYLPPKARSRWVATPTQGRSLYFFKTAFAGSKFTRKAELWPQEAKEMRSAMAAMVGTRSELID